LPDFAIASKPESRAKAEVGRANMAATARVEITFFIIILRYE
jgi:hypothetical protein